MVTMSKKYLTLCLLPLLFSLSSAKGPVECRVATTAIDSCNPYSTKLLIAKEVEYKKDQKKLIVKKTLPVPKKKHIKVISVVDMIEKYVKIEKPVRYEGSEEESLKRLNIENPKINNRYSIAEEIEQRRKKFIEELAAAQKAAYIKQLEEGAVCVEANATAGVEADQTVAEREGFPESNETAVVQKEVSPESNQTVAVSEVVEEVPQKAEGSYTVRSGDTLRSVAKMFRVDPEDLCTLNNMQKEGKLKAGEKITLSMPQELVDIIAAAEYKIRPGDSISMIAQEFNLSSADILKYNRLDRDSTICIGKKLILPFPYKLKTLEKERKKRLAKERKEAKKNRLVRGFGKRKLRVTATAYSSHRGQTDKTPFLAAWNNRIRPGMKIIAVSRDMLTTYGLRNGSKVKIGGLPGYYTVRDKMNKRYKKRIDIYMGTNRRRALRWGRRSVVIYF